MVDSMTPMHGVGSGRTPVYGSQTPQHGDGQLLFIQPSTKLDKNCG